MSQQYPWEHKDNHVDLESFILEWRKKRRIGRWNGIITIHSLSSNHNKFIVSTIIKSLKPYVEEIICTSSLKFKITSLFRKPIEYMLGIDLSLLDDLRETKFAQGIPSSFAFKSLYWRKKYLYHKIILP
ncbi:hypothetical protein N3Z16_10270 (plasmid) [Candidatus Megaera polyxenophila]|uniref:hypothetical protein n=1 Tax=Candidatus Megaera polyxenophila TaxID=988779 RepID=UPI00249DC845|nr:hypothetical protein N3Z16_10270 [Candidatus Megaera polyxenophila]